MCILMRGNPIQGAEIADTSASRPEFFDSGSAVFKEMGPEKESEPPPLRIKCLMLCRLLNSKRHDLMVMPFAVTFRFQFHCPIFYEGHLHLAKLSSTEA